MPDTTTEADAIRFFFTGAASDMAPQRDPDLCLGGYASTQRVESMGWNSSDPMVGLAILHVGPGVARGNGSITALDSDTVNWKPSGGTVGASVAIANGEEKILDSGTPGQYVHVRRYSDIPLKAAHAYNVVNRYNNVIGGTNITDAQAVAGRVDYRAIMIKNVSALSVSGIYLWVGAGTSTVAVAKETPVANAIQTIANATTAPTGVTWNTGTTSGTGLNIGTLAAGEMIGIWIRRTITAGASASAGLLTELLSKFTYSAVEYNTGLRGKFRIARGTEIDADFPGIVEYGIWIGQDAEPNLSAAADETWTTTGHTTSLSLAVDHTYHYVIRSKNKYGLWSQDFTSTPFIVAADGSDSPLPPSAPTDIVVGQNVSDEPKITALYEPAPDSTHRAMIWVIWLTLDGTTPDTADPPYGYTVMGRRDGVETLLWEDSGASLMDDTPMKAIVRTRRLRTLPGDVFSPDTTQLPGSGAGSIVVSDELADWDSTGYAKIETFTGELQEVIEYSALVVGSGISTFTVLSGGRALFGTTATATVSNNVITPISIVDSTNTDVTTENIDLIAPVRPDGAIFLGVNEEQEQSPIEGPDGVTPIVIDAGENVYFLQGEGWTEFWIDTVLVWKCIYDSGDAANAGIYIPSEWDLYFTAPITGTAADSDGFDVVDGNTVYVSVNGQRRMLIDVLNMDIKSDAFSCIADLVDTDASEAVWPQYAQTVFTVWDPGTADYVDYFSVTTAGVLKAQFDTYNTLNQAAVEAL